jgi:hypothetical protein
MDIHIHEDLEPQADMTKKEYFYIILQLKCQEYTTKKEYQKLQNRYAELLTRQNYQ